MLNFDMLGGGSGPLLFEGDGHVAKLAQDAVKELGFEQLRAEYLAEAGRVVMKMVEKMEQ